jgi:Rod binding domain-containing protein
MELTPNTSMPFNTTNPLLEKAKKAMSVATDGKTGSGTKIDNAERIRKLRASFSDPQTAKQKELKTAAQQFEAVFIQQMMTAMDATIDNKDSMLSGGEAEKTFKGMLNQEMATNISEGGGQGFGLAESVYQQSILMLGSEEKTKDF